MLAIVHASSDIGSHSQTDSEAVSQIDQLQNFPKNLLVLDRLILQKISSYILVITQNLNRIILASEITHGV